MDGSLLNQGLTLMLAGMGTVFVFLSLLVGAMTIMSTVARRFEPATVPPGAGGSGPSEEEVAAISAAISMHRKR
ncbi:MAG: OadG family protein [Woeseiaceae bacterium]|nr:OadG family protein [Woeseiaceae bacterium]